MTSDLQSSGNDLSSRIAKHIRPDVRAMHSYMVQDATGMIKLDAMENPHRLPQKLQDELGKRLASVALNRYPDSRVNDLKKMLASSAGMPEGFDLMMGNGSDELISLVALAGAVPGATVLAPVPGFVMYEMSAQLLGLKFVGVPLTADFELDGPAMLAAIEKHKPSIIYLAYPNNPTANLWDDGVIEQIVEAAPGFVIFDEAYQPFSSKSYIDRLGEHSHVLLMRTMSKFGLAGVRLGYMIGRKELIAEIDKVRPPYNISVLNYECGIFALEHADEFARQATDLRSQRESLLRGLADIPSLKFWKSDANMILVRVPDAQKTFDHLKSRGILIKNVSKMHSLLANCLRLTVGTADENMKMLAALKAGV